MAEDYDVASSVGFLYKTMLERDPRKRRVKPVQRHLLQLDFGGLEDSSDDSDFELNKHAAGSDSDEADDISQNSGNESGEGNGGRQFGKGGNDDDDEDDASFNGGDGTDDDDDGDGSDGSGSSSLDEEEEESLTLGELLEKAKSKSGQHKSKRNSEDTGISTPSSGPLKVLICCVCLGDHSEEEDEIVECDGCGVAVHEGCYGIAESASVASTESSASTEPWFCDACKANVKPHCELCPNSGGIYKETDASKWVHIVCALYIPGVAFGDVDRLSPVTLFEMPYSKWGARECSLCEDLHFCRTGVVIGCDAGMCRNYFHVTCAQREGLLSEASPDEEIADPFFAYCKQHAEKNTVRGKRKNWLAIQSNVKLRLENPIQDEQEKVRVHRKLNRHQQKYLVALAKRPPSWVPKQKVPRLLTTCPMALRQLLRKAELLGINTQAENEASNKDIRKKWHVAPALTTEFVSYYLDRNERMNSMKARLGELLKQREKLHEQEQADRLQYDQLLQDIADMKTYNNSMRDEGIGLINTLSEISGKTIPLPAFLRPKKIAKSPRIDTPKSPPALIHQCGLCKKTTDQHLLAKCDSCHKYYHLGCLDPPLTRMPKKTKLMGWQCSECVGSSSGNDTKEEKKVSPNAPRKLREKIKEPAKFTPPHYVKEFLKKEKKLKTQRKKRTPVKHKLPKSEECEKEMPVLKKERPIRMPKLPKAKDAHTDCVMCGKPGTTTNTVRCDDCQLCYHLKCLDPPLKKSPKQRGYSWLCTACDTAESDPESARRCTDEIAPETVEIEDDYEDEDDDEYMGDVDLIDGTVAEDDMMADEYEDDELESISIDSVIEIPDDDEEEEGT